MRFLFITLLLSISTSTFSQNNEIGKPIDFSMVLSSNFGELRPNHFHSGLDFKTQGVINKNIYAVADGYVSRIGVNAGGYGLVLYVDHPALGYTSVYGHLNKFNAPIASFVKQQQYAKESYTIDLSNLSDTLFQVKKGDVIAYSGNTGSSGGPHLHFEIREIKGERPIDPLLFYKNSISDTEKPVIKGISIYQLDLDSNIVLNSRYLPIASINKDKNINAWGNIGFGINAIDKMTGTTNIYGVKSIDLFCDDELIFSYNITQIDFGTTRMINSLTDYDYWKRNKQYFVKSMIDAGNLLDVVDQNQIGYVDINEEKIYNMKYVLKDIYDNTTSLLFNIEGKKVTINKKTNNIFYHNHSNRYSENGLTIYLPANTLSSNIILQPSNKNSNEYFSDIYTLGDKFVPSITKFPVSVQLKNDTLENKNNYGIVTINDKGKMSWVGGDYENGCIFTYFNELGNDIAISVDSISPTITPVNPEKWSTNKKIVVKLSDNLSGIKSFKGTIDGEYALFQHDIKSSLYTYIFDPNRISRGDHTLHFEAVDRAGNKSTYEYNFTY